MWTEDVYICKHLVSIKGVFTPVDLLLCSETGIQIITLLLFYSWCGSLSHGKVSKWTKIVNTSHVRVNWALNSQVSGVAIQLTLLYSQSLKPCELQKLIPNHQSSFCWICLALLTLSIIRSSCPPSHHWTSLGFHFAGLNPISRVGLSGWPGEGRYPKHINWSLRFPRAWFLDPSFSPHT